MHLKLLLLSAFFAALGNQATTPEYRGPPGCPDNDARKNLFCSGGKKVILFEGRYNKKIRKRIVVTIGQWKKADFAVITDAVLEDRSLEFTSRPAFIFKAEEDGKQYVAAMDCEDSCITNGATVAFAPLSDYEALFDINATKMEKRYTLSEKRKITSSIVNGNYTTVGQMVAVTAGTSIGSLCPNLGKMTYSDSCQADVECGPDLTLCMDGVCSCAPFWSFRVLKMGQKKISGCVDADYGYPPECGSDNVDPCKDNSTFCVVGKDKKPKCVEKERDCTPEEKDKLPLLSCFFEKGALKFYVAKLPGEYCDGNRRCEHRRCVYDTCVCPPGKLSVLEMGETKIKECIPEGDINYPHPCVDTSSTDATSCKDGQTCVIDKKKEHTCVEDERACKEEEKRKGPGRNSCIFRKGVLLFSVYKALGESCKDESTCKSYRCFRKFCVCPLEELSVLEMGQTKLRECIKAADIDYPKECDSSSTMSEKCTNDDKMCVVHNGQGTCVKKESVCTKDEKTRGPAGNSCIFRKGVLLFSVHKALGESCKWDQTCVHGICSSRYGCVCPPGRFSVLEMWQNKLRECIKAADIVYPKKCDSPSTMSAKCNKDQMCVVRYGRGICVKAERDCTTREKKRLPLLCCYVENGVVIFKE